MNTKDLVLNIAVNLDRISRFLYEGKEKRAKMFMDDNEYYMKEFEKQKIGGRFGETFKKFKKNINQYTEAEDFLNWANILQHRVKLLD